MKGKTVCMMHGGKLPSGPAHSNWKGGRHSKVLPGRLLEKYEESLSDETLLSLRHDLALVETRLQDVLSQVDSGASWQLWKDLRAAWRDFKKVYGRDEELEAEAFNEVNMLVTQGYQDWSSWQDVFQVLRDRRKMVESERKAMVQAQQYITVEQGNVLLSLLVESVRKHVHDTAALSAIVNEFRALTGVASSEPVDADYREIETG